MFGQITSRSQAVEMPIDDYGTWISVSSICGTHTSRISHFVTLFNGHRLLKHP